jgi:hypothetical protein
MTQTNILEDLNLQLHLCENLKSRNGQIYYPTLPRSIMATASLRTVANMKFTAPAGTEMQ